MLAACGLGRQWAPTTSPLCALKARVWLPPVLGAGAGGVRRRRTHVAPTRASKGEEGVAAVGSDLNWGHVARDIKARLAAALTSERETEQLQAWLRETRLSCDLPESERGQTEIVAAQEATYQGLEEVQVDVKRWLSGAGSADEEGDAKMAGVLTLRALQAYHDGSGEAFDDENDDCYWRLQGFLPGGLVETLDHDTLRRMIKAYVALPFSGV